MSDLYDDARAVRDAMLVELDRTMPPDVPEPLQAGYRLGMHLCSLVMVGTAQRVRGQHGPVESEGLHLFLSTAIAQVLMNAALGFRPMSRDGQPMPPMENLVNLTNMAISQAAAQIELQQAGAADFMVPLDVKPDGSVTPRDPRAFDFQNLMNKGQG